jgi:hypothetical protein
MAELNGYFRYGIVFGADGCATTSLEEHFMDEALAVSYAESLSRDEVQERESRELDEALRLSRVVNSLEAEEESHLREKLRVVFDLLCPAMTEEVSVLENLEAADALYTNPKLPVSGLMLAVPPPGNKQRRAISRRGMAERVAAGWACLPDSAAAEPPPAPRCRSRKPYSSEYITRTWLQAAVLVSVLHLCRAPPPPAAQARAAVGGSAVRRAAWQRLHQPAGARARGATRPTAAAAAAAVAAAAHRATPAAARVARTLRAAVLRHTPTRAARHANVGEALGGGAQPPPG